MGGLNIFVNNVGIGFFGSVEDEDYVMFQKVMMVDVDLIFFGCKYVILLMCDYGFGLIINISLIVGIIVSGNYVVYNMVKVVVWYMLKLIVLYCVKIGGQICLNLVYLVFINMLILDCMKEMFGEEEVLVKLGCQILLGKVGELDDIVYVVFYLVSDESKLVIGIELKVDGGISVMQCLLSLFVYVMFQF